MAHLSHLHQRWIVWWMLVVIACWAKISAAHVHENHVHVHESHEEDLHPIEARSYEERALRARSLHDFDVVTPSQIRIYHLSTRRSMLARNSQPQPFPDDLHLELNVFDTIVRMDLIINEHLFHPDAIVKVHDGDRVVRSEKIEHFYYKGTAKSSHGTGWARLAVHETVDGAALVTGAFSQDGVLYHIKTPELFAKMKARVSSRARHAHKRSTDEDVKMVVYRSSDIEVHDPGAFTCGVTDEHIKYFNSDPPPGMLPLEMRNASDFLDRDTRVDAGCPLSMKVIYMGIVADSSYVGYYTTNTQSQILNDWNLAGAVYQQDYNVYLGILLLEMESTYGTPPFNQPCSSGLTIIDRLSLFSQWRGTQPATAGLYHLLTACATLPTIGIAWLNQLCLTSAFSQTFEGVTQYVSGCSVSTVVDEEWIVVAHEIGHNFGSVHDCISSTCPATGNPPVCNPCGSACDCEGQYIMNPTESGATGRFSAGTQTQICSRSSVTGTCLSTLGSQTILNKNFCGNGIKEPGEECDCGGVKGCAGNTCCYVNCTLIPPAGCNNDTNTQCCRNCQVNPDTTYVCRPKSDPYCDVAEYCDGVNPTCPAEQYYLTDGLPCSTDSTPFPTTLTCASGVCTSRALQCYNIAQASGSGASYTSDCPAFSGSCEMFCSSTLNSCTFLYSNFINGTVCGNGGLCVNGACSVPDLIGTVIQFIQQNLILVSIGAAMVGLLVLGFLYWGCKSAGRKAIYAGKMTPMKPINSSASSANAARNSGRPVSASGRPTSAKPNAAAGRPTSAKPNAAAGRPASAAGRPASVAGRPTAADEPPSYETVTTSSSRVSGDQLLESSAGASSSRLGSDQTRVAAIDAQRKAEMERKRQQAAQGETLEPIRESNDRPPSIVLSDKSDPVRCPICNNIFPSEAALDTHLDLDHE